MGPQGPTFPSDSPNQDTLGAADEAHQHEEADDDVKQQQAQVPQPPVDTHRCGPGMEKARGRNSLGLLSFGAGSCHLAQASLVLSDSAVLGLRLCTIKPDLMSVPEKDSASSHRDSCYGNL